MTKTDALATMAFCILSTRGQTNNPTLHEITLAVVQAAPLLDVTTDPNATRIQLAAADKLIRRHKWKIGDVVLLDPSRRRMNGYQHTRENAPKRETTTARPDEGASR